MGQTADRSGPDRSGPDRSGPDRSGPEDRQRVDVTRQVTFSPGFFERDDPSPDAAFYSWPRFVTHIDDQAIAAVGDLYEELGITGEVLDVMSSWISHFRVAPRRLTVLGMSRAELEANPMAGDLVVHDLNRESRLPFGPRSFDAALCCVSVDYLTRPVEVFADVARVLRPGAPFVCTFSNRCFPTKAIRGWLYSGDEEHCAIVASYFRLARGWDEPVAERRTPRRHRGDPLFAVWARRSEDPSPPNGQAGSEEAARGAPPA